MIISPEIEKFIYNAVKTARMGGIDHIVIDSESVRGIDESRTVLILHKEVPPLPFKAIAITRVSLFLSRINLVKDREGFSLDIEMDSRKEYVHRITFKAKGTKIDYRCGNPFAELPPDKRIPRQLTEVLIYKMSIDKESINLLNQSKTAMSADKVVITNKDGNGVSFAMSDIGGDILTHSFTPEFEIINSVEKTTFSHTYSIKLLIELLNENIDSKVNELKEKAKVDKSKFKKEEVNPTTEFTIGKKGTLNIEINGINLILLPRM